MSNEKPLGKIEKAKVESYHRRQDEVLIEQLRQKMRQEETAAQIGRTTGIADEGLLARLTGLGINAETVPILHLIPLLAVAWADGEIQEAERALIEDAAQTTKINDGPARALLDELLENGPDGALLEAAMEFITHLMAALPDEASDAAGKTLAEFAWRIADANGGIFGLWTVSNAEKETLRDIANQLSISNPTAAETLLSRV
jgi:uncharacterized tellurite resistance protein B-like protein